MNPTPDDSRFRATRPASRLVRGAGADREGDFPMFDVYEVREATEYEPLGWYWRNLRDGIFSPSWGPFRSETAARHDATMPPISAEPTIDSMLH